MKRKSAPLCLLLLVLFLCGCRTISPFLNSVPFIRVFGEEGQTVITARAEYLSIEDSHVERVNVCLSEDEICGSIEGSFSEPEGKIAASLFETDYQINIPCSGVAVFSNKDVSRTVYKTITNRKRVLDTLTCLRMIESDIGIYCKNPSDLSIIGFESEIDIKDKVDYILVLVNYDIFDLEICFNDEKEASSAMTLLKYAFVRDLRERGETVDIKQLSADFILNNKTIYIYNRQFDGSEYFELIKGELGL